MTESASRNASREEIEKLRVANLELRKDSKKWRAAYQDLKNSTDRGKVPSSKSQAQTTNISEDPQAKRSSESKPKTTKTPQTKKSPEPKAQNTNTSDKPQITETSKPKPLTKGTLEKHQTTKSPAKPQTTSTLKQPQTTKSSEKSQATQKPESQPQTRYFGPDDASEQYRHILNVVRDFAETLLDPFLNDHNRALGLISTAMTMPENVGPLRRFFEQNPDMTRATCQPNTDIDIDIAEAIVFRFAMENVFLKNPCFASEAQINKLIEREPTEKTQPDLGERRRIRERHNALLINSKPYQKIRPDRIRALAGKLALLFVIFRMQGWASLVELCQKNVIEPCVAFHERMLTSADPSYHLNLDLLPTQKDFFGRLGQLDCTSIDKGRGNLDLKGVDLRSIKLRDQLSHVLAITPALSGQQIVPLRQPEVLTRQRVLVRGLVKYKLSGGK